MIASTKHISLFYFTFFEILAANVMMSEVGNILSMISGFISSIGDN
jgi:hypothetical protein